MALSSKVKDGSLIVMESIAVESGKTKVLAASFAKLGFTKRTLIIDGSSVEQSFAMAASNLIGVDALPAIGANVYDILRAETLVLTRAGVEQLEARLNG